MMMLQTETEICEALLANPETRAWGEAYQIAARTVPWWEPDRDDLITEGLLAQCESKSEPRPSVRSARRGVAVAQMRAGRVSAGRDTLRLFTSAKREVARLTSSGLDEGRAVEVVCEASRQTQEERMAANPQSTNRHSGLTTWGYLSLAGGGTPVEPEASDIADEALFNATCERLSPLAAELVIRVCAGDPHVVTKAGDLKRARLPKLFNVTSAAIDAALEEIKSAYKELDK